MRLMAREAPDTISKSADDFEEAMLSRVIAALCRAGSEQADVVGAGSSDCSQRCPLMDDGRYVMPPAPSGGRDIGFCPRRKISVIRMGLPQQGHGSRRVSGAISVCGFGAATCSGCGTQSKARILVMLALRVALASSP